MLMPRNALESAGYLLALGTRPLPPWWRFRLYHHLHKRLFGDPYWCDSASRPVHWTRVQPHGYEMELSGSDWMERYALHTGTFYSGEVIAAVAAVLRPGDCFIDVGANIGFVTLCAAGIVGPAGQVFAFEPNQVLVARLNRTLAHNRIPNVTVLPFAAGNRVGAVGFAQDAHHGNRHVVLGPAAEGEVVPMRRIDDVLQGKLPERGRVMVKLDIEGAEMMALLGMPDLIQRPDTIFLIEVSNARLRQSGSSADDLFALMRRAGYAAFLPFFPPLSFGLQMRPLAALPRRQKTSDVLFRRVS
jgi:FkbM family methyltransferase